MPAAGVAVTVSERPPTMNLFLTKSNKSDDRLVQRIRIIRHKHGRRSYSAVGVSGDSQSHLERELIPKIGVYSLIILK